MSILGSRFTSQQSAPGWQEILRFGKIPIPNHSFAKDGILETYTCHPTGGFQARSPTGCTVIPWMFDTQAFAEKAATIAKEKADALAKQELEELQVSFVGKYRRMAGDGGKIVDLQDSPQD